MLIKAVDAGILPKRESEYSELIKNHGEKIPITDDSDIRVSYKEIFGSSRCSNIHIDYVNIDAQIKQYIIDNLGVSAHDFENMRKKKLSEFNNNVEENAHPPKLWIHKFNSIKTSERDENHNIKFNLKLYCGTSDYIDHIIYTDILKENKIAKNQFEIILSDIVSDISIFNEDIPHVWSRLGVGCWIVTKDDYLLVSDRKRNVGEVREQLSYSSSGAVDRYEKIDGKEYDNTAEKSMLNEIKEEVGINIQNSLKPLSIGIDFRPVMQLSYCVRSDETSDEIVKARKNAIDNNEFKGIFIKFKPDDILNLIQNTKMEAGAAWSLWRLYQLKRDNNWYI